MSTETFASWLLVLTFSAAFAYLAFQRRDFSLLGLAGTFSTAGLLCFGGLLFTALLSFLAQRVGLENGSPLLLGLMVPLGTLLAAGIRSLWRRQLK